MDDPVVDVDAGHAAMEVMGIYKRGSVPRESDLPEDYGLKHCQPDQIMVRQRLHTRPLSSSLLDGEEGAKDEEWETESESESSSSESSDDGDEADDESDGNGEENEQGTKNKTKKKSKKKTSERVESLRRRRRRLRARAADGVEYDVAVFEPEGGLVMRKGDWPFYHADLEEHSDSSDDERVYDERAILWQSIDNYEALMSDPATSKYFLPPTIVEADADTSIEVDENGEVVADATPEEAIELILDNPRFGEQVIVKGISAEDIAVGDVFEVEGGLSPLKVEVSSPRLPCAYVDKRNGAPFGNKGVRGRTMTEGLAGWFTRVLAPGELRDGMRLVRTAHPHPRWTLREVSRALYGEGPKRRQLRFHPFWNRSREELRELCDLKALGRVEWKDEAKWILDGKDPKYENDLRKKKEEEAEERAARKEAEGQSFFSDEFLGCNVGSAWVTGGLAAACSGVALATFCSPIFGQT